MTGERKGSNEEKNERKRESYYCTETTDRVKKIQLEEGYV